MHFRFLQFPKTSLEHTLSDSGLHPRVPDLALLIQPIPFPEAGNENAYRSMSVISGLSGDRACRDVFF